MWKMATCDRVVIYYGGRVHAQWERLNELLVKPDTVRISICRRSRARACKTCWTLFVAMLLPTKSRSIIRRKTSKAIFWKLSCKAKGGPFGKFRRIFRADRVAAVPSRRRRRKSVPATDKLLERLTVAAKACAKPSLPRRRKLCVVRKLTNCQSWRISCQSCAAAPDPAAPGPQACNADLPQPI